MLAGEKRTEPTYRVVRQLDEGATGVVHLVWHNVFGREMVQKTADTVCVPDSVAFQEPQLLDRIDHERVVRVREAQPDPQYPHAVTMVMDYYPEGSASAGSPRADGSGSGPRCRWHATSWTGWTTCTRCTATCTGT
ncbi:MAG: hypothetical protein M3P93_03120 [Actinomycetota bacterium]|nr:hypothetical protein [Actinomycetota bacterium]